MQNSDTDTLVDRDIPGQIRIRPDVPEDIPTTITHGINPDEDQRPSQELLLLKTQGEEDPFNVDSPDFEWPELTPIDWEIMGTARATAWEF